jgi:hypothetical protein
LEYLTAVERNRRGEIINFQTSEGRIISYRKAAEEIKNGKIGRAQVLPDGSGLPKIVPEDPADRDFAGYPPIF